MTGSTIAKFDQKVILITGAGGGQGRAAALLFASHGATVVGCDISAAALEESCALVKAAGGQMTGAGSVDLGDPEQARIWVEQAAQEHGKIDIVYNNGSSARFMPIAEMTVEDWHYTMRNEIDLVFYVTCYSWPFLSRRGGVIINTASVSGHTGTRAVPQVAHSAAKGAVIAFTKQIAVEGAPLGIRAVSISPGVIETPGTRDFLNDPTTRGIMLGDALLPRPGQPEEVAQLALFLASDEASYITGADFLIDGGRMAI